jgi:NADPH:quinone reductase-like Zn-dependent oxidoreductase
VRVRAAGLNRGEFIIGGLTKAGSAKPLGIEGAGEVVKVGAQVTRFRVRCARDGSLSRRIADYVLVDEALTLPVPDSLSWEEAGALPTTFMVAHDMLMLQGGLKAAAGCWSPASPPVSASSALQIAKALGARVIGTSGSQSKLDKLKPLGLDVAVCSRNADFHAQVMDATGGAGVNLVVNNVGGTCSRVRALPAFEGRLATVGYVDNVLKAEIDLQALHAKRLVLFGVSQKMTSPAQKAEGTRLFAEQILPLVAAGRLRPLIDRCSRSPKCPRPARTWKPTRTSARSSSRPDRIARRLMMPGPWPPAWRWLRTVWQRARADLAGPAGEAGGRLHARRRRRLRGAQRGRRLSRALGQPIIIDNKPGAGSSLAADFVPRRRRMATRS